MIKYRIPENVVFETVEDEIILLNLMTGIYFSLNKTGASAWRLIERFGDLASARISLRSEYGVEDEVLDRDLVALIGRLVEKGLLAAEEEGEIA